jgi:hypothetical protein
MEKLESKMAKNCCASKIQQKLNIEIFPDLMRQLLLCSYFFTLQIKRECV